MLMGKSVAVGKWTTVRRWIIAVYRTKIYDRWSSKTVVQSGIIPKMSNCGTAVPRGPLPHVLQLEYSWWFFRLYLHRKRQIYLNGTFHQIFHKKNFIVKTTPRPRPRSNPSQWRSFIGGTRNLCKSLFAILFRFNVNLMISRELVTRRDCAAKIGQPSIGPVTGRVWGRDLNQSLNQHPAATRSSLWVISAVIRRRISVVGARDLWKSIIIWIAL